MAREIFEWVAVACAIAGTAALTALTIYIVQTIRRDGK
jgi:hypothetical protein